jgi:tetratricopeptide (TPR) repeat protein
VHNDQRRRRNVSSPAVICGALVVVTLCTLLSYLAPFADTNTDNEQDSVSEMPSQQSNALQPLQQKHSKSALQVSPVSESIKSSTQTAPHPPTDETARLTQLGFSALTAKDYAKAEDAFLKILANDPNNNTALFGMSATKQIGTRDFEAAIPFLEKIIELNPQNLVALTNLMNLYQQTNKLSEYEEVRKNLKEQLDLAAVFEKQKAQDLISKGDYKVAVAYLQTEAEAATGSPKSQAILEELGNLARSSGRHEDALDYYQRAEEQCGDGTSCTNIQINAAWTLWAIGRQDEALASMQTLEQQNPSIPGIHDHVNMMQNTYSAASPASH